METAKSNVATTVFEENNAVSKEAESVDSNIITILANQLSNGDFSNLSSFIDNQFVLLQEKPHQRPADEKAYKVAHSLFEMMVTESSMARAIVEEPEEWDYENLEDAESAAEGLMEHVKDVYTVAEVLLLRSF